MVLAPAPAPIRFAAVTVKEYVVPLVKPVIVQVRAVVARQAGGTGTEGDTETV